MANILFNAPTANFVTKTLSGTITDTQTTITLNSTTNLQAPGVVVIDRVDSSGTLTPNAREVVSYTGISGSDLTGCTRGADNSTNRTHADSAIVETMPTVGMWNSLSTIVATAVTTDGYLKAIASPVSIARMQIIQEAVTSIASIARIEGGYLALNSVASIAQLRTKDTLLTFPSIASVAVAEFEMKNVNGNIVLKPGVDKFVLVAVESEANGVNSVVNNAIIIRGWKRSAQSGGADTGASFAVSYGVTLAAFAFPVVSVGPHANNAAIDPSTNSVTSYKLAVNVVASTTTGFTSTIAQGDGTNIPASSYFVLNYLVIGAL